MTRACSTSGGRGWLTFIFTPSRQRELAGFHLYEKFPYEDNCGCFEFVDGFTQMRCLEAYQLGAVEWETVPGTTCEKANLQDVDKSTPAYQEFERQLTGLSSHDPDV